MSRIGQAYRSFEAFVTRPYASVACALGGLIAGVGLAGHASMENPGGTFGEMAPGQWAEFGLGVAAVGASIALINAGYNRNPQS